MTRLLTISVALAAIAIILFWINRLLDVREVVDVGPRNPAAELQTTQVEVPVTAHLKPLDTDATEANETRSYNAEDCITPAQLQTHPITLAELERLNPVSYDGPRVESYRGMNRADILNFAQQEDSAAMAVLGAVSVMRARGLPDSKAVSYLLEEETDLLPGKFKHPLSAETERHLEESSRWFYKSALHGRLLALSHIGRNAWMMGNGPVELGWISQEDYDSLSRGEQTAIVPGNIYRAVAFHVAPELNTGPAGEIVSELLSEIMENPPQQQTIVEMLSQQFEQDRIDAGLPQIVIPKSSAPSADVIRSMLCKPQNDVETGN